LQPPIPIIPAPVPSDSNSESDTQIGPNLPNANRDTPLPKAVCSGRLDMVRWLMDIGVDIKHADGRGTTAAHLAAELSNR
jgi:hypothetical protein